MKEVKELEKKTEAVKTVITTIKTLKNVFAKYAALSEDQIKKLEATVRANYQHLLTGYLSVQETIKTYYEERQNVGLSLNEDRYLAGVSAKKTI